MEKLTPKEWRIKTCLDIQNRKAKAARAKKITDIQAQQVLVERSLNAKANYYRQRKK